MELRPHLTPMVQIEKGEILRYREEFHANHETENVTWELAYTGIDEYYERQREDQRSRRFGLFIDGELTGLARISARVNFEANGKIGYSIRPSKRGRRYSLVLLGLIGTYCQQNGIGDATACVDVRNTASIRALRAAGFMETGRIFDWQPNPEPRQAIEFLLHHEEQTDHG